MSNLNLGILSGQISIEGADRAESAVAAVTTAMTALGRNDQQDVRVQADTTVAARNLDTVHDTLVTLGRTSAAPTVQADTTTADRNLDTVQDTLDAIERTHSEAVVSADTTQASRDADHVLDELQQINHTTATVDVDSEGVHRAGEAVESFRDEAKSNLSEVASSFTGSMDSAVDVVQGTLGGLIPELGPAGLIGGALAAAGIGLGKSLLQGTADAVNQAKQDVQDLVKEVIDAGGDINNVDWTSKIVDFGTTIVDQKSWWEVWQKDAVTNLDKVRTESQATGLSIGTLLQGEAGGDLTGAQRSLDALRDKSKDLAEQIAATTVVTATSQGAIVSRNDALVDQRNSVDASIVAISKHVDELQDSATAADELTAATTGQTVAQVKANRAIDEANDALRQHASLLGDAKSAELDYKDAVDDVTDGVKEYHDAQVAKYEAQGKSTDAANRMADADVKAGRALDESTQAGRDNQRALLDLKDKVLAYADATESSTGSTEKANKVISQGREEFIKQATAAGMSKAAAKKYADELGLIPEKVHTSITASTDKALEDIGAVQTKLNGLHDKTVTITSRVTGETLITTTDKNGHTSSHRAYLAGGGEVHGPGGPRDDLVPIMGSNGEFMVNAASYAKYGPLVRAINADRVPARADGGPIGAAAMAGGAVVTMPTTLVLRVGEREFTGYLEQTANRVVVAHTAAQDRQAAYVGVTAWA